jgi:drug/metabolite transporter superfamily protein YnfA
MSRREAVWRFSFAALAIFGYVEALVLAAQGSMLAAIAGVIIFAACAFMALDDAVTDI